MNFDQALLLATQHLQAGRLTQAESAFRSLLAHQPRHADFHFQLATIFKAQGRFSEAVLAYQEALLLRPSYVEARYNLANTFKALGKSQEAIDAYRSVIHLRPTLAEAHNNLGNLLKSQGQLEPAIASYREAITHKPENAEAHNNLAAALDESGHAREAIISYRRAVEIRPRQPEFLTNLAKSLQKAGQSAEAAQLFRQAIALQPDSFDAQVALANVLFGLGHHDEALLHYNHARLLRPDHPEIHYTLGLAHVRRHRFDAAITCFKEALRLHPAYAQAANNLGQSYKEIGDLDAALAAFEQAVAIDPSFIHAASNYLYTLQFHPAWDGAKILAAHQQWRTRYADPLKPLICPHPNDRSSNRRLKIGYISPDFTTHCQSNFTIPLLSHHDAGNFHITCYSDVHSPTPVTESIKSLVHAWCDITTLSDEQTAQQIREDQIDILIDLTMHMAHNRLLVFARKPAPVQATWLAYPGTTGLDTIDYRFTDPFLDPPSRHDACYSETSLTLPDSFWCYDPLLSEPTVNELPALAAGRITFGCLNNFCKVNNNVLALWSHVLHAVPDSRLFLLASEGGHRQKILDLFATHEISHDRIRFFPHLPREAYFKLYHQIDLCLDTFPYNGHTTSLDAFWMGVPVVTLVGTTVVGRAGLSQWTNLASPEWIAHTPGQYVEIATRFARDIPTLAQLRATLRHRMEKSPLMDAPRFAQHMENAYRGMWNHWCNTAR